MKIPAIHEKDDVIEGGFYYVKNDHDVWKIRCYTPMSKAFTKYGTPNIPVSAALEKGVFPVPTTPPGH